MSSIDHVSGGAALLSAVLTVAELAGRLIDNSAARSQMLELNRRVHIAQ